MKDWIRKIIYTDCAAIIYSFVLWIYNRHLLKYYPSRNFSLEEAVELLSRSGVWIVFILAIIFCALIVYMTTINLKYNFTEDNALEVFLLLFANILIIALIIYLLSNPILRAIATIFGLGAIGTAMLE